MNEFSMTFEYDIFLSFSSKDESEANLIWQRLKDSGVRIFWSDKNLKHNIGEPFFEVIQRSLIRSKHFVLLWTPNSIYSEWVKLEYVTFFQQCHLQSPRLRRFIIYKGKNFVSSELPPFLKNIQSTRSLDEIISITGFTDISTLQKENKILKEKLQQLENKLNEIQIENNKISIRNNELEMTTKTMKQKNFQLTKELETAYVISDKLEKNCKEKVDNKVYYNYGIEYELGLFGLLLPKGLSLSPEKPIQSVTKIFGNQNNFDLIQLDIWKTKILLDTDYKDGNWYTKKKYYINTKDINGNKIFESFGTFHILGIPKRPRGSLKIHVSFEVNIENIFTIKASLENANGIRNTLEVRKEE